ncbi:hypothetical protein BX616_004606 [Lobosporangium transversale]|nr:hypothetical protein BX616_004606 [Lobosporangium transversale]
MNSSENDPGQEANMNANTRATNRRSDSHSATAMEYQNAAQVKECGLCKVEFGMFKWRVCPIAPMRNMYYNICSQCRRVVCSDCLTKRQIDHFFLLGLQEERNATAADSNFKSNNNEGGASVNETSTESQGPSPGPQDITRPGLLQSASDSAVQTGSRSELSGASTQRSHSFNNDSGDSGGYGYGGFGNGWRAIKGNTDSGHAQIEKLCDPCSLGLSADQIKVLESGGGWQYYQATLGKHQTPALAAALALSNMSLEDDLEANNEEGEQQQHLTDDLLKLERDTPKTEMTLVRAG